MIMVAVVAVVAVAAVVIGVRRRCNAGQRCSERHCQYQGEKTLRVHMDAPFSLRNLRAFGRQRRNDYRAWLTTRM
ncbi:MULTISPECIES: hypothetical protein [unclassified Bradyrhizobium]